MLFCGKGPDEVEADTGPSVICNECVDMCNESKEEKILPGDLSTDTLPTPRNQRIY